MSRKHNFYFYFSDGAVTMQNHSRRASVHSSMELNIRQAEEDQTTQKVKKEHLLMEHNKIMCKFSLSTVMPRLLPSNRQMAIFHKNYEK